ncbi:hypothetical protein AB7250_07650 [Providencia stuartii]|uniref:hypothetical protein n=1 Tax=Providencia TaxID=586 RepID=UPI0013A7499D|nr:MULTISPECIES: hypothetical protein [Providencia]MBQ0456036.1 hypothetical protein [Providencia stuartii]MDN7224038.1 hypothetical protein [Providencia stuartii]QIB29851.1 hypothetical protein G3A48_08935 [Providencia stuartii]QPN42160.1 hypothetical protein I3B46_08715 [Providencia sp. 2.29]WAZ77131.1 hypothetical protein O4001_12770 [Providencia stuartii]
MSLYINPKDVLSPKGQVEILDIIFDSGRWGASVALLNYRDSIGDEFEECIGMRWNGSLKDNNKGTPLSRGYPIWFIIPDVFKDVIIEQALASAQNIVDSIVSEIRLKVLELKKTPNEYLLHYETSKEISNSDINLIRQKLSEYKIFPLSESQFHTVNTNGIHNFDFIFIRD